jgi:hypothetical protein
MPFHEMQGTGSGSGQQAGTGPPCTVSWRRVEIGEFIPLIPRDIGIMADSPLIYILIYGSPGRTGKRCCIQNHQAKL